MTEEDATHFQGITDFKVSRRGAQRPRIAYLATGLGVERRAIKNQQRLLTLGELSNLLAVAHDAEQLAARAVMRVVA